jgi:two-component system nitrogen regulation response regulator NtrX
MPARRVLIVDDEPNIRRTLTGLLEDEGFDVKGVSSAEEALAEIRGGAFDLLLLDVLLPGMDGITFLERLGEGAARPPVIVLSGHATIEMAVRATKLGAFDLQEKPVEPERLLLSVRNVLEISRLREENRVLRASSHGAGILIGEHPLMGRLREEIGKAAPSNGRVLIQGENGTGKELVARAIHEGSPRRSGRFVKVNCAAIPKDLIESELFGHEKGAFTGATDERIGKIEAAEGGTLLLDEVGDMSLDTQAKLLRVLEAKELERVGGKRPIPFDVRVLSATNKNLREEIEKGRFREDLYYRLAVIPLRVPPLRERASDIGILAGHFLRLFAEESGRKPKRLPPAAIDVLVGHAWPGNVRELRNTVERLVIMSAGDEIGAAEVAAALGDERPRKDAEAILPLRDRLERFEIHILREALQRNRGNVAETARELKTDRANLHRKMRRYAIRPREV